MNCVWLVDDAEALLTKNLVSAEQNLKQIAFDLDYLRDQMTITEVGVQMAFIFSFIINNLFFIIKIVDINSPEFWDLHLMVDRFVNRLTDHLSGWLIDW